MCYHISTPSQKKLDEQLPQYEVNYKGNQYYHVSSLTRPFLPVTLNTNHRTVETAQWKLLPSEVRTEQEANDYANTYNAESETIFEETFYRNYIHKNRGLLWVDGFYEPRKIHGTEEAEDYFIYLPEKRVFSIGIVYAPWMNEQTGNVINTFSIITTEANELLGEIPNQTKRMPLIIAPDDRGAWLDAKQPEQIKPFFIPFNGLLSAHRVSRITSNQTGDTNRSEVQQEVD